ncbi:hypothetical protein BDV11DRAFT_209989 [Aspergillus similis]
MTTVYVDGENQGDCVRIRMNRDADNATFPSPVANATSDNNAPATGGLRSTSWTTIPARVNDARKSSSPITGFLSVQILLKGGDYLAGTELLALHAAQDSLLDPLFYVGCAESLELPYPIFGAAECESHWRAATQKDGLQQEGCILVRDNCSCAVLQEMLVPGDKCWDTHLPTGNKNCQIWQKKCTEIDTQCSAGNWNEPPNKGKVLTPALADVDGGMKAFSGGANSPDSAGSGSGSDEGEGETKTAVAATTAADATAIPGTGRPGHGRDGGRGLGRCKAKRSH